MTQAVAVRGSTTKELVGRVLLWVCAAGAVVSAVSALPVMSAAPGDTLVVETWRAYGYLVFAGFFALLALRPVQHAAVWALLVFHKLAMTVTALAYLARGGIADASTIVIFDGSLTVLLVVAFWLCGRQSAARR